MRAFKFLNDQSLKVDKMGYFSIWPMLAVLMMLVLLVATPLFKAADAPPIGTVRRIQTLDGLRGFLALAVFFHHAALYHTYVQDGLWRPPSDRFFALLGPFGVSMFFMITGFLFWSQVLAKKGRPDWVKLYVGRIFRIGPLYIVAVVAMLMTVFFITGPKLHVSPMQLLGSILQWSALGLRSGSPINGFAHPGDILANVTWSLRWEWFFYASLMITALFARNRISAWALPATGFALSMAFLVRAGVGGRSADYAAFLSLFSLGMLTAALQPYVQSTNFRSRAASLVATALILIVLTIFPTAYAAAPVCLIGGAFFMIANGVTLFGLLETRPAKRLGDISFGIYLLQGLVLAAIFASEQARALSLVSPIWHWCFIAIGGLLITILATVAHVLIERPGIDLGRRIIDRTKRKSLLGVIGT